MFTGIIGELGRVASMKQEGGGLRLSIQAAGYSRELQVNDSIAVNGVCLTVVEKSGETVSMDAVEETLRKTALGSLTTDRIVNLELPLRLNERLGGHLVLGHVDTVGTISEIEQREMSTMFTVRHPGRFEKYVIPVGSVAVDGVSLTVAEVGPHTFRVSIIPHTMSNTIFQHYKIGDPVNLEYDLVGKYIERNIVESGLVRKRSPEFPEVTTLREIGF